MKKGWMRHLDFFLVDILSLALVWGIITLEFYAAFTQREKLYVETAIVLLLLQISIAFLTEAYEGIATRGLYKELAKVLKQVLIVSACFTIFCLYIDKGSKTLLNVIITGTILWTLFMYSFRIIWKHYLHKRYVALRNSRQVLIVTTRNGAKKMLPNLTSDTIRNFEVGGLVIVDKNMEGQYIGELQVTASRENILEYVDNSVIDEVLLNIPDDSSYEWQLANEFLMMGATVHIYMQQQYERLPNRSQGNIFGYDVLTSTVNRITFRQTLLKRLIDIAGGVLGLCFCLLIGVIIGPIIYIKSPGNILFSQIRVGKGGRKFRIYKFRSMYMDAEKRKKELMAQNEMKGHMFKMKNDPRIIKGIGHFIRKTSLDEFPQFWNVLKGDMSLVGTRPPTVDEYEKYEMHHKKRMSIKPGITGMWQISGRNDIMDFEEVVKLDVQYIENYSLELDLKILIKTVLMIFKENGAE